MVFAKLATVYSALVVAGVLFRRCPSVVPSCVALLLVSPSAVKNAVISAGNGGTLGSESMRTLVLLICASIVSIDAL